MHYKYPISSIIGLLIFSSCAISNNFGKQQTRGLKHSGKHYSKEKTITEEKDLAMDVDFAIPTTYESDSETSEFTLHTYYQISDSQISKTPDTKAEEIVVPKATSKMRQAHPLKVSPSNILDNHLLTKTIQNDSPSNQRTAEGFGIASMIIAIVGWLLPLGLGVLFCIVALIFAAISLSRIMNHPDKYKGAGFAITGLILSIIGLLILLVVAS